jgi:hypothetical protein
VIRDADQAEHAARLEKTRTKSVRRLISGDPGWARYETNRRPVMVFDEPSAGYEDLHAMERVAWA